MVLESFHYSDPAWYAAYTCSRREKQVAQVLHERDVECFLPLYRVRHRHAHGDRRFYLPLFPGYVFVHIPIENRLCVLQVPGVVQLVSFNGRPAAMQDSEIESLQNLLHRGLAATPYPYLKVNRDVEICSGPLRGLRGKIVRAKGHFRMVVSVNLLCRSVAVDLDACDLGQNFSSVA